MDDTERDFEDVATSEIWIDVGAGGSDDDVTIERPPVMPEGTGAHPKAPPAELSDALDDGLEEVRKVRVHPRRSRPRSKTIALRRLSRKELAIGTEMFPPVDIQRPQTRAECAEAQRPCPWVACKHHLYLDINPRTGSIKLNFPELEPWDLEHTCALDVAEAGGKTLEEIGAITNLTRERVRQLEARGIFALAERARGAGLR